MRNIYDCVEAFEKLLDIEYRLILGRKNVSAEIKIVFDKKECFHLMGLQYLTDRPELVHDRGKIFDAIKEHRITAQQLESSDLYDKIAERVDALPYLETILDSNDTIFRYNNKINTYSVIKADYLMQNNLDGRNVYVFLARSKGENQYYCRSFSRKENWTTQGIRLYGRYCIKKRSIYRANPQRYCITDYIDRFENLTL